MLSLVAGSGARAYSAADVSARNWNSDATQGVAGFLLAHRSDGSIGCTLDYCSFYWLAGDQKLRMAGGPSPSHGLWGDAVEAGEAHRGGPVTLPAASVGACVHRRGVGGDRTSPRDHRPQG